jgi:hypothetical protein
MWSAAERLRTEIGSPLPRVGKARYDRLVAAARAAVGDDAAFSQAWQEGALTLEQAIELALVEAGPAAVTKRPSCDATAFVHAFFARFSATVSLRRPGCSGFRIVIAHVPGDAGCGDNDGN